MRYFVCCLAIASLLMGCSRDMDNACERVADQARAKGQDPQLVGIWYKADDHEKVQAGKDEGLKMRYYAQGGYFDVNYRKYLSTRVGSVWYTEGDTLHRGLCRNGQFVVYASVHYLVRGDTLWTRTLSKPIDPNNPGEHFYLRLKE